VIFNPQESVFLIRFALFVKLKVNCVSDLVVFLEFINCVLLLLASPHGPSIESQSPVSEYLSFLKF